MEFIEKKSLRAKIIKERNFIRYILKENVNKVFCSKYCEIHRFQAIEQLKGFISQSLVLW